MHQHSTVFFGFVEQLIVCDAFCSLQQLHSKPLSNKLLFFDNVSWLTVSFFFIPLRNPSVLTFGSGSFILIRRWFKSLLPTQDGPALTFFLNHCSINQQYFLLLIAKFIYFFEEHCLYTSGVSIAYNSIIDFIESLAVFVMPFQKATTSNTAYFCPWYTLASRHHLLWSLLSLCVTLL